MALIQNLREYIITECSEKRNPTLSDIISKFDMHQHAIPNLDELKNALKSIESIAITRKDNQIVLSMNDLNVNNIDITENDLSEAYNLYCDNIK